MRIPSGPVPRTLVMLPVLLMLTPASGPAAPSGAAGASPTAPEAVEFVRKAEEHLQGLGVRSARADWVQANFITVDTDRMAADVRAELLAATTKYALEARRFDGVKVGDDVARKLMLMKLAIDLPASSDPKEQVELAELGTAMEGAYGRGRYCPGKKGDAAGAGDADDCLDINAITRIMAESRDAARLLDVWRGWHTVSPPMRPQYQRFVELANKGAREMGQPDLGALWRSSYDMPPEAFAAETDRLWKQVEPLYRALHAHVRAALVKQYGDTIVPPAGPIPAHLLGNIWAQSWNNIYPLVAPPDADPGYDVTALLKAKNLDARAMVQYGERFFTSLGFEPLPPTFWERSLLVKPADRDVICHASAWNIDAIDDLRIKMCIEVNEEDLSTIHHELGHNFYQRAYKHQPPLFRSGANGAFHEAIGDTIALSITPEYLKRIGLLNGRTGAAAAGADPDLGLLMKMALDKVAFLPFGLLVDRWRWQVFSGEVKPAGYNRAWWDLRLKYQGVAPAVARTEADFDPGAKYHVPANVSYTRYFLAHILQFQFHRALCREAGFKGPLYQCSVYDNKAAGARLKAMLEMGASRPWPEALHALTGERQMDATAILDYFAPLKTWLDEQNRGRKIGW